MPSIYLGYITALYDEGACECPYQWDRSKK